VSVRRSGKWILLAIAGVGVAYVLMLFNDANPGDPLHGFRSGYFWVLAVAWVALMLSAIFVEKRR
jgi:hypothetical protein